MKTCQFLFNSMSQFSRKKVYGDEIPTFEETFETEEEAIGFGFAEGKKLIDSG
jgi:hypothetical protein